MGILTLSLLLLLAVACTATVPTRDGQEALVAARDGLATLAKQDALMDYMGFAHKELLEYTDTLLLVYEVGVHVEGGLDDYSDVAVSKLAIGLQARRQVEQHRLRFTSHIAPPAAGDFKVLILESFMLTSNGLDTYIDGYVKYLEDGFPTKEDFLSYVSTLELAKYQVLEGGRKLEEAMTISQDLRAQVEAELDLMDSKPR